MAFLALAPFAMGAKVSLDLSTKGPYETGERIEIIYRFEGVGEVPVPSTINAGGLVFRNSSSQALPVESRGVIRPDHVWLYFYEAVPDRPGRFSVPKRPWRVAGKTINSPGKTIQVRGSPIATPVSAATDTPPKKALPRDERGRLQWLQSRAAATAAAGLRAAAPAAATVSPAPRAPQPLTPAQAAPDFFAGAPEVTTTDVFLGEAIPVTLKFFLRADQTFENLLRPSYAGNGFIPGPVDELKPETVTTDGALYHQITLQTTVTPLRTGPLEIPGVVLQGRRTTDRLDPGGPPPRWTNFSLASGALRFDVAPLPAERPDDFTGGVGQFEALAPDVDPRVSGGGEPVTLRFGVEGRGNLRAMQKPVFDPASSGGWRVYDGGETIESSGADGSGTKFFEFQLLAVQDRAASPGASLSYFDPREKKFIRLQFPPEPLKADAEPAAAAPSPAPGWQPLPAITPGGEVSAEPVARSRWFLLLQLLLGVFLLAWTLLFLVRRRADRGPAARRARLRADLDRAWGGLRAAGGDQRSFYDAAAQVALAHLGVLQGKPVPRSEAGRALERLVPNLAQREELAAVLDRSDELNYGVVASEPVSDAERRDLERLLEEMDEKD